MRPGTLTAMFLPLSDVTLEKINPAYVTWTLLALNVAAFVYQWQHEEFTYSYAAVSREITTGEDLVGVARIPIDATHVVEIPHGPGPRPIYLTLLTSMFLHAGLAHLGANMLFLWIFGDNVEHRFGPLPFLGFYLVSGLAGGLAQVALDPDSVVPMLGASGAISGVLGAYLILFPYNKINVIVFIFMVSLPAVVVIAVWFVSQLVGGYGSLRGAESGGVAYAAHLGGFAAGVAAALLYRRKWRREPASTFATIYHNQPRARRLW